MAPFGTDAFQPNPMARTLSTTLYSSTAETQEQSSSGMSKKKEDRLTFMKSDQFHRRGFKEVRNQVESAIQEQYQSPLVNDMKASNYLIERDGVKVYLAKVCLFWNMEYMIPLRSLLDSPISVLLSDRILDSAGEWNEVSPWPMRPWNIIRIANFTLPMN